MTRWLCGSLVVVSLCAASVVAVEDQGLYLHELELTIVDAAPEAPATIQLYLNQPERVARDLETLGYETLAIDDESLTLRLGSPQQTVQVEAPERERHYTRSSFVIDHAESDVRDLMTRLEWPESAPEISWMSTAVYDWITDKTLIRDFDFASRVARTRVGDCTEHATLLTALARASGVPARVALGVLIVDAEGLPAEAFGHAWTEYWDGASWQLVDATEPERYVDPSRLHYIPLGIVEDESPSIHWGTLSILARSPKRLVWARPAD